MGPSQQRDRRKPFPIVTPGQETAGDGVLSPKDDTGGGERDGLSEEQARDLVDPLLAGLKPEVVAALRKRFVNGQGGPRYALRRRHRAWEVIYNWERAVVGDEVGLWYVEYLLKVKPGQSIHGIELAARVHGRPMLVEGSLEEKADPTEKQIKKAARELSAVLADPTVEEAEKTKARQELVRLAATLQAIRRAPSGNARKCVAAVRQAIGRMHQGFASARWPDGSPDRVLRGFAQHLRDHLIIPSSRYSGRPDGRRRAGVAGCFVYEPPPGVVWED